VKRKDEEEWAGNPGVEARGGRNVEKKGGRGWGLAFGVAHPKK